MLIMKKKKIQSLIRIKKKKIISCDIIIKNNIICGVLQHRLNSSRSVKHVNYHSLYVTRVLAVVYIMYMLCTIRCEYVDVLF